MPLIQRTDPTNTARRQRRTAPSCRGGASSMLRLAPTGAAREPGFAQWLSRAANALAQSSKPEVKS